MPSLEQRHPSRGSVSCCSMRIRDVCEPLLVHVHSSRDCINRHTGTISRFSDAKPWGTEFFNFKRVSDTSLMTAARFVGGIVGLRVGEARRIAPSPLVLYFEVLKYAIVQYRLRHGMY